MSACTGRGRGRGGGGQGVRTAAATGRYFLSTFRWRTGQTARERRPRRCGAPSGGGKLRHTAAAAAAAATTAAFWVNGETERRQTENRRQDTAG